MANSKYEYVKSFEEQDKIMLPNLIVVVIDGHNFRRFSETHQFGKPNDKRSLELMKACATSLMEEYPDIVFSYGFSDEYSFALKRESKFYQRRESKILSLLVSFFTSVYIMKWKEFFPHQELLYTPSFKAQVIRCATLEVLQNYLAWRQNNCHLNNQYDTCFWKLVENGKSESEAHGILKGTQKKDKNELLFRQFGINYKNVHPMFRQGTCLFKTQVEDVVKKMENGDPVKRLRRKVMEVHSENIAGKSFWNQHSVLVKELGIFQEDVHKIRPEYLESFQALDRLMPSTWIVIRIDGCHFHRFSDIHAFEKPNDEQALNLMNSCAAAVLEEFKDVIFAYGVSDEYSFVLKKESKLYERHACGIVSVMVSFFSSMYIWKWKDFFPQKTLKYCPSFDGRAVCYPSTEILRDYLSWRQVDCHINNQYNTCFWMLVKSGKSKQEAQNYLKGTQTHEKNNLLIQNGIDYDALPDIFRRGSCVFRNEENKVDCSQDCRKVVIKHCNIIDDAFWESHPWILEAVATISFGTALRKEDLTPARRKNSKWTTEQNLVLLSGWIKYGTDRNQKSEAYWGKIAYYCNEHCSFHPPRDESSCRNHYNYINKILGKWIDAYDNAKRMQQGGWSENDVLAKAHELYSKGKNGHFKLMSEWRAVSDQPRYGSQVGGNTGSESIGSKRSRESDGSGSSSIGSIACPMGRDAAKKKGRKKSKGESMEVINEEWNEFKKFKEKEIERWEKIAMRQEEANQLMKEKTEVKKMKIFMKLSEKEHLDDRSKELLEKLSLDLFGN